MNFYILGVIILDDIIELFVQGLVEMEVFLNAHVIYCAFFRILSIFSLFFQKIFKKILVNFHVFSPGQAFDRILLFFVQIVYIIEDFLEMFV